jgi:hypothetical protein
LRVKFAQSEGKNNELRTLLHALTLAWGVLGVVFVLGSIITVRGFTLWYWRVQEPIDRLLLKQLEESEAKPLPQDSARDELPQEPAPKE